MPKKKIYIVAHSSSISTNGMSLGRDYLFARPMADREMFGKPVWEQLHKNIILAIFILWC